MIRRTLLSTLILMTLAGCTVGPEHGVPTSDVRPEWAAELDAGVAAESADLREWWRIFNDRALDSLVDRALDQSLDLREAAARVREARALRGATAADQLPNVNVGGSAAYRRDSGRSFSGGFGGGGEEYSAYDAGFDMSWEIDVFGGVRRAVEAADADIDAAVESARDARVILVSEVARNYVEFRSAQARLTIARQNVGTQHDTLELTQDRFRAGLSTQLLTAQARAQLESTRSVIPQLVTDLKRAAHRLDVLLGLQPGTLAPELEVAQPVPVTPDAVPVGFPAELLRRRPDIRRAERQLAAATARIGVATADLYPRFTLNGSFGFAAEELGDLFDGESRAWSIGPAAVRWPIFDAGRIRSNIRVQEARQEVALVGYERTVLQSYEEVANAMVSYARQHERRRSLAQAVDANRDAFELANDLWTRGLTDFLNVLDTQRELFARQDELAASDAQVATSLIALYKALGGGWDDQPDTESASGSTPDAQAH